MYTYTQEQSMLLSMYVCMYESTCLPVLSVVCIRGKKMNNRHCNYSLYCKPT